MHHGILKAFDNTTYTATVQLTGSLAQWLRTVPVNRAIPAAEMMIMESLRSFNAFESSSD